MNSVYVIIVTYNGARWIPSCLESVLASDAVPSIIIIDNNSSDNSVELVKKYDGVTLIKSDFNLGFGGANNIGIELAYKKGADFVFLVNQDTVLFPDTISKLLELHQQHPEYGILSPIHLNKEHVIEPIFAKQCLKHALSVKLIEDGLRHAVKPIYDVDFVNAAFWFMSRRCLENVGGFSPVFRHYAEDNNYVDRCRYHGFKLGLVPTALAVHDRTYGLSARHQNFKKRFNNLLNIQLRRWSNINTGLRVSFVSAVIDPLREVHTVQGLAAYVCSCCWMALSLLAVLRGRRQSLAKGVTFLSTDLSKTGVS